MGERALGTNKPEPIEIGHEATFVVGRRDKRLGLRLKHMSMQANTVAGRKVTGHLE